MEIQNIMFQSQIKDLSKENAFLKIKINLLQSKQRPSQITLINKELYLTYMQDVLNYKEKQLIQAEKQLQSKTIELLSYQEKNKLLFPLQKSTEIDIFLKKIQQIKKITVSSDSSRGSIHSNGNQSIGFQLQQWKLYLKNQQKIVQQCRNYQRQTQNLIKTQYQNLIRQRKQYSQSMDKFEQLNSYQKYLNQLQKILEIKQKEILKKEDFIQKKFQQSLNQKSSDRQPNTISFRNQNINFKENSDKKRTKIFESAKPTQHKKNFPKQQYSSNQSGISSLSKPILFSSNKFDSRDQSSFIMQEAENNQSQTLKKCLYAYQMKKQSTPKIQTAEIQTQTNIELLSESIQRLNKEKKMCKFLNLWIKHSINSKKNTPTLLKKTFGLYLWRLNTIFDDKIPQKIQSLELLDDKYVNSLRNKQLFPYNELSINRKKYAQLTLDYQKKMFHRKKIQLCLKNIIKNKSAKQRIVFICYFKKFVQNSRIKMMKDYYDSLTAYQKNNPKDQTDTALSGNSRFNADSRLISVNSSRIMNQNKGSNQNRQLSRQKSSNKSFAVKSMSNTYLYNTNSKNQTKNMKQNISPKSILSNKNETIDAKKLKEFIKQHEEAQKKLAQQCIKTQSVCKLGQILAPLINKNLISSFYELKMIQENQKMADLQKRINKYEFKWELFMTKCKLALVSNNNKISHLQECLGFMIGK